MLLQAVDKMKSKLETRELYKAVYPIFLIQASPDIRQKLEQNLVQIIQEFALSDDAELRALLPSTIASFNLTKS